MRRAAVLASCAAAGGHANAQLSSLSNPVSAFPTRDDPRSRSDTSIAVIRAAESTSPPPRRSLRYVFGLDAERVIDGHAQLLLAPDVALRGLDGHMAQEELNLI